MLTGFLFPLFGSETCWNVSIEAAERFSSVHVFQNQMHHFDISRGAKILEDLMLLDLPALGVNERHIWWICYDTYV